MGCPALRCNSRMLDLPRIERIKLKAKPIFQRVVAMGVVAPNYALPPRVRIEWEGFEEHVPEHPVVFAMNHTDRYNYFPFQYRLWRKQGRFTATWVKGKYYESAFVGKFMEWANNIPTVSRGYLITRDFMSTVKRKPSDAEYIALRRAVDGAARGDVHEMASAMAEQSQFQALMQQPRNMLGRQFDPRKESYQDCLNALFRQMMQRFVDLNAEAFDKGLDLLVFPQGTRSIRLSRGQIGLAQILLRFKRMVVPVGCNGSDRLYPGGSPWAKGGTVLYRFGAPITYEEMAPFHIASDFEPFTPAAESAHAEQFRGLTDMIMERIDDLLDPQYQFSKHRESEGVSGSSRFV